METLFPIKAVSSGLSEDVTLKLFGCFPIKEVAVTQIGRPKLVACGTPFGLKILTDGVMVTGFGSVGNGGVSPAEQCGVRKGDIITTINGISVKSSADVAAAVNAGNQSVSVTVMRGSEKLTYHVQSAIDENGQFRLGLWTRDSVAGIGTLTFYDKASGAFGGLGHSVCDIDTGVLLPVSQGEIIPVSISSVIKGVSGRPGELCGSFLSNEQGSTNSALGSITGNRDEGVYGIFNPNTNVDGIELDMAFKQEIHTGAATILTTINGMSPKEYDIEIEKIDYNSTGVKNMVIKITDPELLALTGGIVQGMSGSPIIQDGRLAGAVTHVFVNDISRGYGIFAENMQRAMSNTTTPQ